MIYDMNKASLIKIIVLIRGDILFIFLSSKGGDIFTVKKRYNRGGVKTKNSNQKKR
jgi:hypothetical protein